jgi:hypothetical protein
LVDVAFRFEKPLFLGNLVQEAAAFSSFGRDERGVSLMLLSNGFTEMMLKLLNLILVINKNPKHDGSSKNLLG